MSTLPRAQAALHGREHMRPSSLYDNLPLPPPPPSPCSTPPTSQLQLPPPLSTSTPGPSLLPALSTTVPVNVSAKPTELAERHAPTRSSLRHSRLVSKAYQKELAAGDLRVFRSRRLASALCGLQLLLGAALCTLALWLLIWAPRLHVRDVPYWSGAPLVVSGVVGLVLAGCPGDFPTSCVTVSKVMSVVVSLQAALSCLVAGIICVLHLVWLHHSNCEPAQVMSASCECSQESVIVLRYPDLSCPSVVNVLVILVMLSSACNLLGCVVSAWLLPLHWVTRSRHGYQPVACHPHS